MTIRSRISSPIAIWFVAGSFMAIVAFNGLPENKERIGIIPPSESPSPIGVIPSSEGTPSADLTVDP